MAEGGSVRWAVGGPVELGRVGHVSSEGGSRKGDGGRRRVLEINGL